jgi:glycosyltransferase involved in cell wall biosynthesis
LAEQKSLSSILKAHKFDLVHFANFNHPIAYRRPFIVTVHDLIMHLYPPTQSWIKRMAYKMTVRDCRRAKKIIVPSGSTKNDLVKMLGFPEQKIIITPEGSESNFHEHTDREKIAVKERLGLPRRYILFVSRWEKYKGLPTLIEAFESLAGQYSDLGLVICGKSEKKAPEIAQLIKDKQASGSKIVTPGFISDEDLAAVYSAADVYVHPSWYEGFGIMILEAFASGVPVITSNISSLPEVVGDAGLLIDPHNSSDIADKIKQILDNPKLALTLKSIKP